MTRKRNQHLNFFGRIGRSVYESTISSQQFGEFGVRASFRSISHISTLAHGQVAPRSVGGARDGLYGLPGGEPEAGVALVGGRPAVADVGGGHGEAVVDLRMIKRVFFCAGNWGALFDGSKKKKISYLRHGAAVDLLAGWDVGVGPLAACKSELHGIQHSIFHNEKKAK